MISLLETHSKVQSIRSQSEVVIDELSQCVISSHKSEKPNSCSVVDVYTRLSQNQAQRSNLSKAACLICMSNRPRNRRLGELFVHNRDTRRRNKTTGCCVTHKKIGKCELGAGISQKALRRKQDFRNVMKFLARCLFLEIGVSL